MAGSGNCRFSARSLEGAVNVGSGEGTPVSRVVDLVAEAAGRPDLVRRGELEPRPQDPPLVADVHRLRDEVGWKTSRSLEEGIRQTVEWWRQNR